MYSQQLPPDVEEMLLKYGLIEQLPTEGVKILVNNSYLLVLIIFYLIFSVKMTFTKKNLLNFRKLHRDLGPPNPTLSEKKVIFPIQLYVENYLLL